MVPTEMEDGLCLLDVIGDPNLLNEFLDAEGESGPTGRPQAHAAAAQAQAEAQVQASSSIDGFQLNGPSLEPGNASGNFLTPNSTAPANQQIVTAQQQNTLSSDSVQFIPSQTVHHHSSSTPSPRNSSPLVQANPHVMVNPIANNHIQYIQGRRSASPATGQPYASSGSPMVSRARTPSQSPIPVQTNVGSPMFPHSLATNQSVISNVKVSGAVTPSQQTINQTGSISPAPGVNLNTFQLQTSVQPPIQVANTMQVQGIIQTPVTATQAQFTAPSGQQFIQQKTVVQAHPNIVQTQTQGQQVLHSQPAQTVIQNLQNQNILQAIQQNPALLQNVNFNSAVSTTQQGKPSTSGVNLYSTVQGSVQNPVGLQGTIIQTAQGKSILIPNQLSGQPITVAGLQNLQPITVRPQMNIGQQSNSTGIATIHTGQGTATNAVGQPQISVLNINPPGQQIVIQRAPAPGQPQNIIVRTIPSNFIQLQTPGGQASQISTSQSQMLSQISQTPQIISNSQTQSSIPLQPLLNSSQGQQINLLNQTGQLQVGPQGTVTLNIGNQNVNIPQVPSAGSFQPTQLQAHPHRSLTSQPTLQPHPTSATLPVISQYSIQSSQAAPLSTTLTSQSKTARKASKKGQSAANKSNSPQVIQPASQGVIGLPAVTQPQTVIQAQQLQTQLTVNHSGHKDNMVVGKLQNLQNVTNVIQTNPGLSHLQTTPINVSSVSYSTANTTPVTTTVSHSTGHIMSHVSVASSTYSAPLTSSTVLASPQIAVVNGAKANDQQTLSTSVNVVAQPCIQTQINTGHVQVNTLGSNQQQPVQLQTIQLSPQDQQTLQKIQQELKPLLQQKPLTPEQNTKLQKLLLLHKRLLNKGRQQQIMLNTQQAGKTGQVAVGQPQVSTQQPGGDSQGLNPTAGFQGQAVGNKVIIPHASTGQGIQEVQVRPGQNVINVAGNISQVLGTNQTMVKLDGTKHGSLVPGQILGTKAVLSKQVLVPAVPANAPPGKLPISASPAVPTQLKIGGHLVTLNLTPQHKEKLQSQLSKMTAEQQQLFYRHQYNVIQRLQQQHQIQQQIQAAQQRKTKPADGKLPATIQLVDKTNKLTDSQQSPGRANKRPATAEIPKGSMIHQQLIRDQEKGLKPDTKAPFKSVKDACQRLLRYHVFQSPGPSLKEFQKVDHLFEQVSQELLRKRDQMFAKYQLLLLEESMREKSTAEMVMIERMLNQDLTDVIEEEKKQVEEDPDSFEIMPAKYLKMSPENKPNILEEDVTSPGPAVKPEGAGSETPVDVEHGSSPENPLDSAKSPVRSVMSSNGGFKLVIRKNHALNFSNPPKSESAEKKVSGEEKFSPQKEKTSVIGDTVTNSSQPQCQVTVLDPPKPSPADSIVAQIKTENDDFEFTMSESIQEVPDTPFKAFSGDTHPHDMFFNDTVSPEVNGIGFSLHTDSFPKAEPAKVKSEFPPVASSGVEDISGDNDTLPDLEEPTSLPVNNSVQSVGMDSGGMCRSRSNSETDAALEGLLNCSNADNMEGYQFDPDDFKPVGNQADIAADQFDISDPFDENGDFFGYDSQYCNQPNSIDVTNNSHTAMEAGNPQVNQPDKVNLDTGAMGRELSSHQTGSQYGLVGQYEAISPVSDRSGGFNEDLNMTAAGRNSQTAGQLMTDDQSDFASFFTDSPQTTNDNDVLNRVRGDNSGSAGGPIVFASSTNQYSRNTGTSSEIESAVDSIMDFGGSGDQQFSPLIINDHRPVHTPQSSSITLAGGAEAPQDLKSHSEKAAHLNPPSGSVVDYGINGSGDSLENQEEFVFPKNQSNAGGNSHASNSVMKDQMESAINSILSPASSDHQGSPFALDSYSFSHYNNYPSPLQAVLDQHVAKDSVEGSQVQSGMEDDLDAAINSILS